MTSDLDADPHRLPERISRLEGSVEALTRDVQSLAESVRLLSTSLSQGQKTNWSTVLGGIGVAVLFGGMLAGFFMRDMVRFETTQDHSQTAFVEHVRDGHPHRVEDGVKRNYTLIGELYSTLRAEMTAAETRMTRHFDLRKDTIDRGQLALERRIDVVEAWQRKNSERYGRNEAKIGVLERFVMPRWTAVSK